MKHVDLYSHFCTKLDEYNPYDAFDQVNHDFGPISDDLLYPKENWAKSPLFSEGSIDSSEHVMSVEEVEQYLGTYSSGMVVQGIKFEV